LKSITKPPKIKPVWNTKKMLRAVSVVSFTASLPDMTPPLKLTSLGCLPREKCVWGKKTLKEHQHQLPVKHTKVGIETNNE